MRTSTGSSRSPSPGEQELGRAWAWVAAGDLPGARQVLRGGAGLAAEAGYRVEAWLLHDVARLGEPATVADRLAVLADGARATWWPPTPATPRRRPPAPAALVAAAGAFEHLGRSCSPPRRPAKRPRPTSATATAGRRRPRARATTLAAACEGARTPGWSRP